MSSIVDISKEDEQKEIILIPNDKRYVLFPIQYHDVWTLYKKSVASFWTFEEIDLNDTDKKDFASLTENEKFFILHVLAFFASSDALVAENVVCMFYKEIQIPEARQFYGQQASSENIHNLTYNELIDFFVTDSPKKIELFNAVQKFPAIKGKWEWAKKWMTPETNSFHSRLIAFAAVEGIFFSGSFCAIYWLKKRGLTPGLTFSNELIARDESLHCDFAITLYSHLKYKLPESTIHKIVEEAVVIEKEFICESLPASLIGMNNQLMSQYIEFVADRLLLQLGCSKIYKSLNPFAFMDMISLQGKTNFFEKRVGEYQKSNVMHSTRKEKNETNSTFSTDEDF